MLTSLKRTAAFFCPYCSHLSKINLSVFNFSGNEPLTLSCIESDCRKNDVRIAERQNKYHITIECPLCEDSHNFTISKKAFWNRPLVQLDCPNAQMRIFFIGTPGRVNKAVSHQDHSEYNMSEEQDDWMNMVPDEMQLVYSIADIINHKLNSGKISCKCKSRKIEAGFSEDSLVLVCPKCGERADLKISFDLYNILSRLDNIILGKNI